MIRLKKVESGRMFRWGAAGDLPGIGDRLDISLFKELVKAASHLKSWCYTHKPLDTAEEREAIKAANAAGWVTNLSADGLSSADRKAALGIAPVVTLLPSDSPTKGLRTPEGRKVLVCPAQTHEGVTCLSCKLCLRVDRPIIGFLAHGTRKRLVDSIIASAA